jgi:hypothetical protein
VFCFDFECVFDSLRLDEKITFAVPLLRLPPSCLVEVRQSFTLLIKRISFVDKPSGGISDSNRSG